MTSSSKLVDQAVENFNSLPGIGRKTAMRLVLHLINQKRLNYESNFVESISNLLNNIRFCQQCNNLSDDNVCSICTDSGRNKSIICIVENVRDVIALEDTGQYHGMYHVLGGVISPLDGIGADDLNVESLISRIDDEVNEIIMAVSPTIEGETTIFYLSKRLANFNVKISQLARGISFGGELEYADGLTLGRSIMTRVPYDTDVNL